MSKPSGSKKFRVVIGVGDKIVAKDLSVMLTRLNCVVAQEAATTTDVILKVASDESKPDIVIMQLGLPGEVDAVQAALDIYEKFNVPTLYIVTAADSPRYEKMAEKNYYGHIRKPYDLAALSAAIQKAIVKHLNEFLKRPAE